MIITRRRGVRDDCIRQGRDGRRGRLVQRVSQKAMRAAGN